MYLALYSHLCIYISTHLHTVYLDWLQAVLESDSRCTQKWQSSELSDTLHASDQTSLEMHFEAVIERIWRCTSRLWLREHREHLEIVIEWIWRCTWWVWSCKLGGRDQASLEILLEAVIKRVWRCTWRSSSSRFGYTLGGRDRAILEIIFKAVIEQVWSYTWMPWSSELGDMHLEAMIVRTWRP